MERIMRFDFRSLFTKKEAPVKNTRSFVGAMPSRFVNWIYSQSYSKINLDIDNGLLVLLSRTRELAKNNTIVRSYLELMEKNIIGKSRIHSSVTGEKSRW